MNSNGYMVHDSNGPFQIHVEKSQDNSKCVRILMRIVDFISILCGIAILSIQVTVYLRFTVYDHSSLPSTHFGENWDIFYTAWILTSATFTVLVTIVIIIAFIIRKPWLMITGVVLSFIAAGASIFSIVLASEELVKLFDKKEIPQHVCVASQSTGVLKSECNSWWGMELAVAILNGLCFISHLIAFITLTVILCQRPERKIIRLQSMESISSASGQDPLPEQWIPRIPNHKSTTDHIEKRISAMIQSRKVPPKQHQVNIQPIGRAPPIPKQPQNRPSLPIVIREKTHSSYFY